MESLDFWKSLIQGEKNAIPDRSGKTAFTDMIDKLSILPPGNQTKKSSEFFLGELSRYFGEFTLMDIRNLMLFLESIIFSDSVEIARKYWKDFEKLGNHTEEEIEKRRRNNNTLSPPPLFNKLNHKKYLHNASVSLPSELQNLDFLMVFKT